MKRETLAIALPLVALLSACGGGGGGGSSPAAAPATTIASLRNVTTTQTFAAYSITDSGDPTDTSPVTSTPLPVIEEGNTTTITLSPSANTTFPYDVRIQATSTATNVSTDITFSAANSTAITLSSTPHDNIRLVTSPQSSASGIERFVFINDLSSTRSNSLSYQVFGFWSNDRAANLRDIGIFSAGPTTPLAQIPSTGCATYTGWFMGLGGTGNVDTDGGLISSRVSAETNFAARSINLNTTGSQVSANAGLAWTPDNTFDLNATLTWSAQSNEFRGTATVPGRGYTGNISGRFYGPDAQELGGVVSTQAADGISGLVGAFGATRGPIRSTP